MIRTRNFTKQLYHFQVGVCFATEHGLKIVVEDSKCVQANTFIGSEIFQVYCNLCIFSYDKE